MKPKIEFPQSSWSIILIIAAGFFLVEIAEVLLLPMLEGTNEINNMITDALIPTIIIAPFLWWLLKSRNCFENALKESEKRFRTLFEGAPDAIFLADPETGIIIGANTRASELTARSHEEIIGMHQSQLHPPRIEDYSRGGFKEHAGKTKHKDDIRQIESFVLRPDGTEVPVEVLAQMVTIKGRPVLQGVFRDITERKRIEKDKERLINAINSSTEGITITDENDRFIYVNAAYARIFGRTEDELIGDTWRMIVPPETIAPTEKGLSETMHNRDVRVFKGEVPGLRKDGSIIPIDVSATGFFDRDGKYQGHVCIVMDITERKKAQEELLKFKLGIERSDESVFITKFDGTIIYVNPAFEKIYGYSREEALGKTPRILKSGLIPSEEYKPFWDTLLAKNVVNGELVNKTKDGHLLNIWGSANPILNDGGEIIGFLAIQRDITEAKRAEELLRKSMLKLEKAQELGQMGSWEWDIATNELVWSDEVYKLYGLDPANDSPKYDVVVNTMTPETRDWFSKAIEDALKYGKPFDGEYGLFRPDGTRRYTHTRGEVILDKEGNPVRMFGMVQDITERKRVEEQIGASLKEKEMLLREIHHRVKNNMQVISSLLWLQSGYIKDKKYLQMFRESQNRIMSMSLIHEKLYRSKDLAKIEFNEYIRDLVNGLFQSHGVKTGTIVLNINVDNVSLGILHAIPCGLLINELITNSLKYAFPEDRKGEISVSLHLNNENMVELKVSDNGVGIPSDVDFRKTESLGLRLVTILAEDQLQGKIDLDRSRGTEFIIKFKGGY